MKPKHALALAIAFLCVGPGAAAADWSFCIAPADAEKRIYISMPFPSIGPKAESEFDDLLASRRLKHDSVQCPRADGETSALKMRQYAIDTNYKMGRQVSNIQWRPSQ